jgi:hypothetical protein
VNGQMVTERIKTNDIRVADLGSANANLNFKDSLALPCLQDILGIKKTSQNVQTRVGKG